MTDNAKNPHWGSTLNDFLEEEGIREEVTTAAIKKVIAWQLGEEMKKKQITKKRLAELMHTSRAQIDRILDPEKGNVTDRDPAARRLIARPSIAAGIGVRASRLATSTMKTDVQTDRKAFATLRFAGDELDPGEISAILPVEPTRAHRKGEEFFAGPNAGNLRGRSGIWFLATDKLVDSDDLGDHLRFVQKLLYPKPADDRRVSKLREVLERAHSHAHVTCFWHGDPGEAAPKIPAQFKSAIQPLVADIETDFGTVENS